MFRTYKSHLNPKELRRLFIEQMQAGPTYYLYKVIGYQVGLDVVIKEAEEYLGVEFENPKSFTASRKRIT